MHTDNSLDKEEESTILYLLYDSKMVAGAVVIEINMNGIYRGVLFCSMSRKWNTFQIR